MFFKNLKIYCFSKPFVIDGFEQFDLALEEKSFQPCASTQMLSMGWVPPVPGTTTNMTHVVDMNFMLCLKYQERILPSSVVNEALNEKLDEIEQEAGRRPVGKYKQSIKDDIVLELMPKAFTKTSKTYAYIDLQAQMIVVDASSSNRAEELIEFLRRTIGSLPVIPLKTERMPVSLMTSWLRGNELKSDFTIQHECELRDFGDDGAILKTRKQDLTADEIQAHLDSGKEVKNLSMSWNDAIEFVLHDDLAIKRLKFSDELLDQAADDGGENEVARFDADFNIMTGVLSKFIARLVEILGSYKHADAA